jgi:hypothetical protein
VQKVSSQDCPHIQFRFLIAEGCGKTFRRPREAEIRNRKKPGMAEVDPAFDGSGRKGTLFGTETNLIMTAYGPSVEAQKVK